MTDIPNGVQVGSEYGDINREIKKSMEQYLEGDKKMMEKVFRLARRREQLLASTYNTMRKHDN